MDSKPAPLKIGMTDAHFIKIAITCVVIVIAIWLALFHYYAEPPAQNPQDTPIEE